MRVTANPADIYAGSKVRFQRRMLRMSQTELGKAIGVTFQQIQKYENGANRISASRLLKMSGVLGVPISFFFEENPHELLTGEGDGKGDLDIANVPQFLSSQDGLNLNRAFVSIKDETIRRRIVALVKALAEAEENLEEGER